MLSLLYLFSSLFSSGLSCCSLLFLLPSSFFSLSSLLSLFSLFTLFSRGGQRESRVTPLGRRFACPCFAERARGARERSPKRVSSLAVHAALAALVLFAVLAALLALVLLVVLAALACSCVSCSACCSGLLWLLLQFFQRSLLNALPVP